MALSRKYPGIYLIEFNTDEHVYKYVGSSTDCPSRILSHLSHLSLGNHHNSIMQALWNKYGLSSMSFQVLEEVKVVQPIEVNLLLSQGKVLANLLIERETYWIETLSTYRSFNPKGLNLRKPDIREPLSWETRLKMSNSKKGHTCSESARELMAAAKRGKKRDFNESHRKNLGEASRKAWARRKALLNTPSSESSIETPTINSNT